MKTELIIQLLFIGLGFMSIGTHIAKHGQIDDSKYNGWGKAIAIAILWYMLYLGGFWSEIIK